MKNAMHVIVALLLCAFLAVTGCALADGAEEHPQRIPATYSYVVNPDEPLYVYDLIFSGDVIISGDNGMIVFCNCEFNGNVINTADEGTRVILEGDCDLNGELIFSNTITETTIEASFPKFIVSTPVNVVCEGCIGTLAVMGDVEITFNGKPYTVADANLFYDANAPEAGFVPYEGQPANVLIVAQWWQGGIQQLLVECEYDASMEE